MAILAECPRCHNKQSISNKKCKCGNDLDKAKKAQRVKYWLQYRLPNGKQRKESLKKLGLNPYSIEDARDACGNSMGNFPGNFHGDCFKAGM